MKIAVLGAGSMGGLFGGYLSLKNEVYLVDLWKEHVEAINLDGLKIDEKDHTEITHPKATCNAEDVGVADLVIVFVKSTQTDQAIKENIALFGEDTLVLTLQNGLGNEEGLLKHIPAKNIIMGTTQKTASTLAPGHVRHNGGVYSYIGPLEGDIDKAKPIADALNAAGFVTEVYDSKNVQKMIWDKLMVNASGNAVSALMQVSNDTMLNNPYAWDCLVCILNEAVSVANAAGFAFEADAYLERIKKLFTSSPNHKSSMTQDRENRRMTEVDKINGAIVKKARELGMEAPYNRLVVNMVHVMEANY